MGRRAGRSIALGAVIGALALAACTPQPDPPQTTSPPATPTTSTAPWVAVPCTPAQATGASTESVPLSEPQAEAQAVAEFSEAPDTIGETPLVTVERHGDDITVTTTDVATAQEAADVAANAAQGSDLVSVEVAQPVQALEDVPSGAASVSNDTHRSQQWALNQAAFESAWATSDGDGVIVAVVDSGVRAAHPDFSGEILQGYERWHETLPNGTWGPLHDGLVAGPMYDDNGHGTHVAGIIAATANNSLGVAGAAPGVKILPVKVLNALGSGRSDDVAFGINWAVSQGADIVSLSLGGPTQSGEIEEAVDTAVANGVLVLAAAGNGGAGGSPNFPGAEPNAIGVASVEWIEETSILVRSEFSTTGTYVDIAAPGTSILSTVPDSSYAYLSGTSMATPYAAAAGALLVSAHPTWTVAQLRERLLTTADDLGSEGKDSEFGCGFIDPVEAVS